MKKKLLSIVLAASMILGLSACGSKTSEPSADSGSAAAASTTAVSADSGQTEGTAAGGEKSLVVGITKAWTTLNPLGESSTANIFVTKMLYETLVETKLDGTVLPRLAKSWDYDGDVTLTLHLAENAVWSDGEPLTADDVVFSLQLYSNRDFGVKNSLMANLSGTDDLGFELSEKSIGAEAADDDTLVFTLKHPMDIGTFLNDYKTVIIAPKHIFEDVPVTELSTSPLWDNLVTSGPYRVVNQVDGSILELEANPNFYLGKPNIDKLTVNVYTTSTLAAAIINGECDLTGGSTMSEISNSDYEYISTLDNVTVEPVYSYSFQYLPINNSLDIYSDVRVRQALSLAINRDEIVNNLLNGYGYPLYTPYNETHPFYNDKIDYPGYDPEGAKKLLEEAGWDWDHEIQLYTATNDEVRQKAVTMVQQYWQSIGLKVNLTVMDFATQMQDLKDGKLEIGTMGNSGSAVPVDYVIQNIFTPGSYIDFAHLTTGDYADILLKAKEGSTNEDARIYTDEFQQKVADEAPFLFLYSAGVFQAYNNRVTDVDLSDGVANYWPVWEWDVTE